MTLRLHYREPAVDWESESLPIGNGFEGASVFGGVGTERLVLSEKTLWTGGPGGNEEYRDGLWPQSPLPSLQRVRELITSRGSLTPAETAVLLGSPKSGYGSSQVFGELVVSTGQDESPVEDYQRGLDLATATAYVDYRIENTWFHRQFFASNPDRVIVGRFTSDGPDLLSCSIGVEVPDNRSATTTADSQGSLAVTGRLHDNDMAYELRLQLVTDGGVAAADGQLQVTGASDLMVVLALGTDYALAYPEFRGPMPDLVERLRVARGSDLTELWRRHCADHGRLFDTFALHVTEDQPGIEPATVPELSGVELDELVVAYGRYLLIASSRPGALPNHLQGLWNASTSPPWSCDMHVNINEQMNHWPALTTGLAETAGPYHEFTAFLASTTGPKLAGQLGARGWAVLLATTPFAYAGVIDWPTAFWFAEASAWLAHDLAEAVRSTGDTVLTDLARPVLSGVVAFWLDLLTEDPDGRLVLNPSYSPEHGDFTAGCAMSGQLIRQVFSDALELLADDDPVRAEAADAFDRVDPGLRIGSWGQLQEWADDLDDPENHHRHVSHLFALYPGDAIDRLGDQERTALHSAAATSLRARGNDGPGWCQAWRSALYARLGDSTGAYAAFRRLVEDNLLPNLWGNHPPFQIDANFGATAAAVEMVLQSHRGWTGRTGVQHVDLLPALPAAWPTGRVRGLVTRAGDVVDMAWRDGSVTELNVIPACDHEAVISGPGFDEVRVNLLAGERFRWLAEGAS